MKKPQVHISVEGGNFMRIAENLINFGYGGLPDKVHFSFSFHPSNPLINFHITREVSDRDNKPQIRIFEVPRSDLKRILLLIVRTAFNDVYEPLAIPYQQHLSRKDFYKKIAFMSFEDLPYLPSIWDRRGVKKGKLKLTEHSFSKIEDWAARPQVRQRLAKQFFTLPWRYARKQESGFLISPGYTGTVLILNGQYYKQRETLDPMAILKRLVGDSIARTLLAKTDRAVRDIQTTADRQASIKYSQPLLFTI